MAGGCSFIFSIFQLVIYREHFPISIKYPSPLMMSVLVELAVNHYPIGYLVCFLVFIVHHLTLKAFFASLSIPRMNF